jgi:hypothetical protein
MSSFTPGPWNIFQSIGLEVEADGIPICEIWQRGDEEQEQANARLIAAAPDLLEALKEVLSSWEDGYTPNEDQDTYNTARAAIRKATGKECDGF